MSRLEGWRIENIATLFITGATIVGLYAVGAGGWSFWALILMLNLNSVKRT